MDLVDGDQRAPAREEREGEDREDAAEDDQHDPRAPASGRRSHLHPLHGDGLPLGRRQLELSVDGLVAALIEAERRISVGHQAGVRGDARDPAVEPEDEVEDAARVAPHEEERDRGEEHEQPDQPAVEAATPRLVIRGLDGPPAPAEEDPRDGVLRDREQPPLHEHEPARQALGVVDLEPRGVVGHVLERERRVPIGAEGGVRVEADPPGPAEDADVEVEDPARVAPGHEDREERDDREHGEGEPEERQQDVVRNREQPFDDPEPAAQVRIAATLDPERIRLVLSALVCRAHSRTLTRA